MQSLGLWPHRVLLHHLLELLVGVLWRDVALDDLLDVALGLLVLLDLVHDLLGLFHFFLITLLGILRELLDGMEFRYVENEGFLVGVLFGG